jgi:hypothetical protein
VCGSQVRLDFTMLQIGESFRNTGIASFVYDITAPHVPGPRKKKARERNRLEIDGFPYYYPFEAEVCSKSRMTSGCVLYVIGKRVVCDGLGLRSISLH